MDSCAAAKAHNQQAAITVFRASHTLGKVFSQTVGALGFPELRKDSHATLTDGTAYHAPADTADSLARILETLPPGRAISLGTMTNGQDLARVVTAAFLRNNPHLQAITRTKEHFAYPAGPGWLLLDIDGDDMPPAVQARVAELGGIIPALEALWPGLNYAERVIKRSSSGGVYLEGEAPLESSGYHIFVRLADVSDSDVVLRQLHVRAWSMGLAWFKLSASGALLERSVIDTTVGSAERLVFAGAPKLGKGVLRDAEQLQAQAGRSLDLHSITVPPEAEAARLAERVRMKPESEKATAEHVERTAQRMTAQTGESIDQTRAAVQRAVHGGQLDDSHPIFTPAGIVTVGELLDRREQGRIGDPLEGEARQKLDAQIVWTSNPPRLVTFLNGPREYSFSRYALPPAQSDAESKLSLWITEAELLRHSDLRWALDGPQDFDLPLYIAGHPDTAQRIHDATGCEVWCIEGHYIRLNDQPSDREIIVALGDLQSKAENWAQSGRDISVFNVPETLAGDQKADRQTIRDAIEAAENICTGSGPVNLLAVPTRGQGRAQAAGDAAQAQDQREQRDAASAQLRNTMTETAYLAFRAANATTEVKQRYAAISITPDWLPLADDDEKERQYRNVVSRAQMAIRRDVKAKYGLDYLPSTTRRKFPRPEATIHLLGLVDAHIAVTGAQGIGKTTALVGGHGRSGILHDGSGAVTVMLFPTLAKADEAHRAYLDNAPTSDHPTPILLRGRSAVDPVVDGEQRLCERHVEAEWTAKTGQSVKLAMCNTCQLKEACAYQAQIKAVSIAADITQNPSGVVIFATHAFISIPLPGLPDNRADLVIIDERPNDMVDHIEVSRNEMAEAFPLIDETGCTPKHIADIRANRQLLIAAAWPLLAAVDAQRDAEHDSINLAELRAKGWQKAHFSAAVDALWKYVRLSDKQPYPGNDLAADDAPVPSVADRLCGIMRAIWLEFDAGHDRATAVVWRVAETGPYKGTLSLIAWQLKRSHWMDTPSIYLDGTADMTVARIELGKMVEHRIEAARNAFVIHVVGKTWSDQSITGRGANGDGKQKAANLRNTLRSIVSAFPGAFVAGSRSVLDELKLEKYDCMTAHYGGLRGLDRFKDCTAAFIIGRKRPPPAALEDEARAYAAEIGQQVVTVADWTAQELESCETRREATEVESMLSGGLVAYSETITDRTGRSIAVLVERHPDELVEAIRQQHGEAETEQSADRLRLIYNDRARIVIVFNSYPCIKPDMVVNWTEFKAVTFRLIRVITKYGFLPTSLNEAIRVMPDILPTRDIARPFVEKVLSEQSLSVGLGIKTLIPQSTHKNSDPPMMMAVRYKAAPRAGQTRIRMQDAVVWATSKAQAREVIEAHLGPLQSFEVVLTDAQRTEDAEMAAKLEAKLSADVALPDTQEQPTRPALAAHDLCLTLHTNLQRIAVPPSVARLASLVNEVNAALKRAEQRWPELAA